MDSSKLTRRIGAMAFSIIAAVASLRITYLLRASGSMFYIDSLVLTFQNTLSVANLGSLLLLVFTVIALLAWFKRRPLDVFASIMSIAVLFILGLWITTLGYSSVQYDTAPWWTLIMIGINVTISILFIAIPLSLIGVFITQILRPV